MANSIDPGQTAPIGAFCSGSTLFASLLNSSVKLGNNLQQITFSRRHFQVHFFLGALRVNNKDINKRSDPQICVEFRCKLAFVQSTSIGLVFAVNYQ